jgi:hypothetical protein
VQDARAALRELSVVLKQRIEHRRGKPARATFQPLSDAEVETFVEPDLLARLRAI